MEEKRVAGAPPTISTPNPPPACVVAVAGAPRIAWAALDAAHDAVHDNLTGLPNRELFFDRLDAALTQGAGRGPVPEYRLVTEAGDDGVPRMRVERVTRD